MLPLDRSAPNRATKSSGALWASGLVGLDEMDLRIGPLGLPSGVSSKQLSFFSRELGIYL